MEELYDEFDKKMIRCIVENAVNKRDLAFVIDVANLTQQSTVDYMADILISLNFVPFMLKYLCEVKRAPKDKLIKAIIESEDANCMYLMSYYVEESPIEEIVEVLRRCKELDALLWIARDVKRAPLDKIVEAVESIGDKKYISKMQEIIDDGDIENQ